MHRCLLVEDIMRLICEELDRGNEGGLHSLSLTSKTFLEPPLNIIWQEQNSLHPLFSVLSSDLWGQDPNGEWDDDDGVWVIKL